MVDQSSSLVRAAALRRSALSLANSCSIRVQIGAVGWQVRSEAPAAAIAWRTPSTRCAARLSSTTTSPGSSAGAGNCST